MSVLSADGRLSGVARWLGPAAAILLGLWVMLAPVRVHVPVGWRVATGDHGGEAFALWATFDASTGRVVSDTGEVIHGDAVEAGTDFTIGGVNGDGWVELEATDPAGKALFHRWVPPARPFFLFSDDWSSTLGIDLVLAPAPAGGPDGTLGRLTLTNLDPNWPVVVAAVSLGVYKEDYPGGSTGLGLDERADGCAGLIARLPTTLQPWEAASCVFGVPSEILLRDIGEQAPAIVRVATAGSDGSEFGKEATWAGETLDEHGYPPAPAALDPPPAARSAGKIESSEGFRLEAPGPYRVSLRSDTGSSGLAFESIANTTSSRLAASEYPMSALVGGLWVVAGVMLPIGRRAGGVLLAATGFVVAGALVRGLHAWYWASTYALVGAAAAVSAGAGLALAIGSRRGRARTGAAAFLAVLALLAGIISAGIGIGSRTFAPHGRVSYFSYAGDYIGLAFHIIGVVTTVVLAATAGALWGTGRSDPTVSPSAVEPPG